MKLNLEAERNFEFQRTWSRFLTFWIAGIVNNETSFRILDLLFCFLQCSFFPSSDKDCGSAQSEHAFTNSRFSFYPVRNISGACTGRNAISDPIYDKLRHASTRHESNVAAENAPVEKYEYQAEVLFSS